MKSKRTDKAQVEPVVMPSDILFDDISFLKSLGCIAIANQYREMVSTLRVIHTWASFRNGETLVPQHTIKLIEKALKRFRA
jgi:hypothetical protein